MVCNVVFTSDTCQTTLPLGKGREEAVCHLVESSLICSVRLNNLLFGMSFFLPMREVKWGLVYKINK